MDFFNALSKTGPASVYSDSWLHPTNSLWFNLLEHALAFFRVTFFQLLHRSSSLTILENIKKNYGSSSYF